MRTLGTCSGVRGDTEGSLASSPPPLQHHGGCWTSKGLLGRAGHGSCLGDPQVSAFLTAPAVTEACLQGQAQELSVKWQCAMFGPHSPPTAGTWDQGNPPAGSILATINSAIVCLFWCLFLLPPCLGSLPLVPADKMK